MPLINGEKFACSSCIKGHRVSGCTHTDRELHHIQPKGRPVKQCEHCRTARKSKSHHAKCDCGDKKDKDKHKDKGDAKGESQAATGVDGVSSLVAADDESCCCHSGSKCICGLKKDGFDLGLKLDTGKHTLHGARVKPKLTTTHSESTLTVFANGHHKPCHRNNNSAHVSGAPYKIPRPHSLHGSAMFAAYNHNTSYGVTDNIPQRSADTLSLSNNDYHTMFGSAQRSFDSLPLTPLTGSLESTGIQDPLFTASQPSTAVQDGASPESQSSDNVTQWPWATNATPVNRNFGYGSLSTSPSQDCLPNLGDDWAIPSAGLNNPVWSAGDLPLDPSKLVDSLAQPISHSGDSKQSAPALTTASSVHSEIGETPLFGDLDYVNPPSAVSSTLFWEDSPVYRPAPSAPAEMRPLPTSAPTTSADFNDGTNESAMFKTDVGFAPNMLAFSNASVEDPHTAKEPDVSSTSMSSAFDYSEPRAIAMPNNIDDVPSNDPWLLDQTNMLQFGSLDTSYSNWPQYD